MKILGIETSCDETAASVVEDGKTLLSNVVFSSMDLHKVYGGVVPEIAARSHIESILPVIDQALTDSFQGPALEKQKLWSDIDGIAVTYGAGLGGSLLIGVLTARTLAISKNLPLYGINHVEAHVYANFLTSTKLPGYSLPSQAPKFPMLASIVSGGHTQLVLFKNHFDYTVLGKTQDDAIGEAFDKVAKILGLPYPGGPSVAKKALEGDSERYTFPKSKLDGKYDFSFSGLKTAVLRLAQKESGHDFTFPSQNLPEALSEAQKADIAASFQRIAIETVIDKAVLVCDEYNPKSFVIAGGVASNQELRNQISERIPLPVHFTDPKLCTDNGAMVATLGCYKAMLEQPKADPYTLDIAPSLSM